jgi:hypothetical protein
VIDYRKALDLKDGIPGAIRDKLHECPETGSGEQRVFRWIFYVVNRLIPYCTPDAIFELLLTASASCGRETDSDIRGAIATASGHRLRSSGGVMHSYHAVRKESKAPSVDYGRVVELYRKHGGYDEFLTFCGTTPELMATETLAWRYDLYRSEDIVGLGWVKEETTIGSLEDWAQLLEENFLEMRCRYCFLTPNPYRPDANGRCNAGILERRYFVIECDIVGTKSSKDGSVVFTPWHPILEEAGCSGWDLQAGIILHLFELGYPIVSIVHSGGKSLHVWCSAYGLTEDQILRMIAYAAGLGADDAGKTVSQFMRLPNPDHGSRKQHLIYHNPVYINK